MASVKQDPEQLMNLCRSLRGHMEFFANCFQRIKTDQRGVQDTWRDDQGQDFLQQMDNARQRLRRFNEEVDRTVQALTRDARQLELYRNIRMSRR